MSIGLLTNYTKYRKNLKMLTITDVQVSLQRLTNTKISYTDIGNVLGTGRANISLRAKNNSKVTEKEIELLEKAFNVELVKKKPSIDDLSNRIDRLSAKMGLPVETHNDKTVSIVYRPDVYLSAGYGLEVYSESAERMVLDASLFVTPRGNKINPDNCEIVRVYGNSMSPEYKDGDRVVIDRSDTNICEGQIYALRYKGQCFVKEINILNNRIKCVPINKEYDPFYIEDNEDFCILGRILPRIRL